MCRNIKTLFNFEPPATPEEVHAASLQFVRKICGTARPSQANSLAFDKAVSDIDEVVARLLDCLKTSAPAKNRELEALKARERAAERFAR